MPGMGLLATCQEGEGNVLPACIQHERQDNQHVFPTFLAIAKCHTLSQDQGTIPVCVFGWSTSSTVYTMCPVTHYAGLRYQDPIAVHCIHLVSASPCLRRKTVECSSLYWLRDFI